MRPHRRGHHAGAAAAGVGLIGGWWVAGGRLGWSWCVTVERGRVVMATLCEQGAVELRVAGPQLALSSFSSPASPLHLPLPNRSAPPQQDVMRLDDTARMNTPGLAAGNWTWRVGGSDVWRQLGDEQAALQRMIQEYDRAPTGGIRGPAPGGGRAGSASFRQ